VPPLPPVSLATRSSRRSLPAPAPSASQSWSAPLVNVDSFGSYEQLQESILCQALIFVGYLCLRCPENQNFFSSGTPPSLLVRLCNLPIHFFTEARSVCPCGLLSHPSLPPSLSHRLKQVIFPTLIAFCFENDSNLAILRTELSPTLLSAFLRDALAKRSNALDEAEIAPRFPPPLWEKGIEYFAG
jgi:hypothetical protein